VNPLTALECAGNGLEVRPLGVDIPFKISLLLPDIAAPHPLREALVQALRDSSRALQERLGT
jgi:hypothetical protein